MTEDQKKQAIKELKSIYALSEKIDFSKKETAETVCKKIEAAQLNQSIYGKRFAKRLHNLSEGHNEQTCIVCGLNHADNYILCSECAQKIGKPKSIKPEDTKEHKNIEKSQNETKETNVANTINCDTEHNKTILYRFFNKKVGIFIGIAFIGIIILSVIFEKNDVIHIIFPYYHSELQMMNFLQGAWVEYPLSDFSRSELVFIGDKWDSYSYGYTDDVKSLHHAGNIYINNYKNGTFYLSEDTSPGQVKYQIANDKLSLMGMGTYYIKIEASKLADNAYSLEEMEQKRKDYIQKSIDEILDKSDSLSVSDKTLYWTIAKEEVKSKLKAPRTAKFPFAANSDGVSITKTGNIVTVSSYVDAENSFGTMLRNNFTVKIQTDNTNYSIISCTIE